MLLKTNIPDFSQFTANNCEAFLQTSQRVWPTLCSQPYGLLSSDFAYSFSSAHYYEMSPLFSKCHITAWRPIKTWWEACLLLQTSLLRSKTPAICKFDELSIFWDMQVAQFVSLFWQSWSREYWQSIGQAVRVFVSSGSAVINYIACVLTHITLCCHSYREVTLMSLSPECTPWPSTAGQSDDGVDLLKLASSIN